MKAFRFDLRNVVTLTCCALFVLAAAATATIHRVDCTGATGFPTIQDGVDACDPGDTVLVISCAAGPYAPFVMDGKDRCHVVGAEAGVDTGSDDVGVGSAAALTPLADVSGPGDCAIVTLSSSCSIHNLHFTDCEGSGIVIAEATDTVISDNRITRVRADAIVDASSVDSQITGNVVGLNEASGIVLTASRDAVVTDNLVGFNGGIGVFVPPLSGTFNAHISNNSILSNSAECIFDAGEEDRIERNGCSSNCAAGICGDEIVIGGFSVMADVVGNDCAGGTLLDLGGGTELDENTCP